MTDAELALTYIARIEELEPLIAEADAVFDRHFNAWLFDPHRLTDESMNEFLEPLAILKGLKREHQRLCFLTEAQRAGEPITLAALRYQRGMSYPGISD